MSVTLLIACAREAPVEDSVVLQARAAASARAFAANVAAEPPSERTPAERVARDILVAAAVQSVYVLDPELVALDLATGAERWRTRGVTGYAIDRAGRYVVVRVDEGNAAVAKVAFVDPVAPERPRTCPITPPAPRGAGVLWVTPFDRAGKNYVHWYTQVATRHGGTPHRDPDPKTGEGCGILELDVDTCAARPAEVPGASFTTCSASSPSLLVPAVAASAPKLYRGQPTIEVEERPDEGHQCERHTRRVLHVRSGERVLWSHPLPDVVSICGPP